MNDETVVGFVQGKLSPAEAADVDRHVATCPDCFTIVAEAGRFFFERRGATPAELGAEVAAAPIALAPGTRILRYVIGEPIGVGGWGIVYEAHDPELRRKVAIKLLRPERAGGEGTAQTRLLREAQAMAQLSHPNVVHVYDVGTFQGMVFIVMELVAGDTLTEWLRRGPRTWREVLDTFVEAGRGLAAAHTANLVHRDFKPDNVLIGLDGRVRVTDFGLVRSMGDASRPEHAGGTGPGAASSAVTAAAGTPVYMAPEQFLGRKANPRTDQFSFCVALYQALHGQHPFVALSPSSTVLALAEQVLAGRVRPAPNADVPAWLHEALLRGLSADADKRHASMDDLIAALAPRPADPAPTQSRRGAAGALLAFSGPVLLAGVAVWQLWGAGGPEGGRCGDGEIRAGVEECDDGNTDEGDGCSASCLRCAGGEAAFVWAENGHCYTRHDRPASFSAARALCRGLGGDLAVYTGNEGWPVHRRLLESQPGPRWIGMFFDQEDKTFKWVTNESTQFMDWASGQPRSAARGQCVYEQKTVPTPDPALRPPTATSRGTAPCEQALPFTCERAPWKVRPADGHAYRVVSHRASWDDARAACAAVGAHLVTIQDPEEQAFVIADVFLELWLGASDQKVENLYEWSTGEPLGFRAFAPGEPDDKDGTHDCVLLGRDRRWHDRRCEYPQPFACEID